MRRVVATGFAIIFSVVLTAGVAGADPIITDGEARVQINVLDPIVLPQSAMSVTATSASTGAGNLVETLQFGSGVFGTTGLAVPVTDPTAFPIIGVQATASNGVADFARGRLNAGKLGGTMPLNGINKVCLYGSGGCSYAQANISVPISVVGVGGIATVFQTQSGMQAPVFVTVLGAPWTTQTVAVGSLTRMAIGNTAMTQNGGATITNNVQLVTPVFVSTNIPASAVVPVFGTLQLTLTTPEPGTIAAVGAAIAALVSVGMSRRKR